MIPSDCIPTPESKAHSAAETGVREVTPERKTEDEKKESNGVKHNELSSSAFKPSISQQEQLAAIEKYTSALTSSSDDRQIASLAPEPPSRVIHYRNVTQESTLR